MPDSPDYSKYRLESARVSLSDMGELAVRLGSPAVYSRQGSVIFQNCFEYGLSPYNYETTQYPNVINLNSSYVDYGAYSLKMTLPYGGVTTARLGRKAIPVQLNKFGFEVGVCFVNLINKVDMRITHHHLGQQYAFRVLIYDELLKAEYAGADFALHKFADITKLSANAGTFRNLKFIVDLSTHKFHELHIDNDTHSIPSVDGIQSNTTLGEEVDTQFYFYEKTGVVTSIYLGHMIHTIDEI